LVDKNNNKPPERNPSSATLALVEDIGGAIRLVVQLDEVPGTNPELFNKMRIAIAGLSYIYDKDSASIENMGQAFIDGMDEGFSRGRRVGNKEQGKKKKSGNYKDSTIGFNTNQ